MSEARARKGLGRGLSALLADDDPVVEAMPQAGQTSAPISLLEANPDQPRKQFDPEELEALAASIREKGVLQPILVRRNPRNPAGYEIIAGERRWRAAQRASLHDVPIVVRDLSDAEALEVAIIENVQRVDLNPVEEAKGYARLIDAFDYTQDQLAHVVSKSRSHIANMMRLLKLPRPVLGYLRDGTLSMGHARALIGHADAEAMADEIVRRNLSVREVEARLKAPPRDPKPLTLVTKAPDADTAALEADLSAALGAKVKIEHKGEGGQMVIAYRDLDQLDEICARIKMTPG